MQGQFSPTSSSPAPVGKKTVIFGYTLVQLIIFLFILLVACSTSTAVARALF